ncbi:MAG: tyrosine protein phosphatase [Desulfobacterales bacterium]|nr:tyrosine protein phosphatase [Desulfobacterales bacterium]
MIDLHAHILPGLDDGPELEAESLAMARTAVMDGITILVATPHCLDGRYHNFRDSVQLACNAFNSLLAEEGINLQVLPGAEIRFAPELVEQMDRGRLMTLNDTGRYFLLELPDPFISHVVSHIVFQMAGRGLVPIICHPERNKMIQRDPEQLRAILAAGALSQITGGSLTGQFGRRARETGIRLVKAGMVHFMGSDAHSHKSRPPRLADAFKALGDLVGSGAAEVVRTVMPRAVLAGEPICDRHRDIRCFSRDHRVNEGKVTGLRRLFSHGSLKL